LPRVGCEEEAVLELAVTNHAFESGTGVGRMSVIASWRSGLPYESTSAWNSATRCDVAPASGSHGLDLVTEPLPLDQPRHVDAKSSCGVLAGVGRVARASVRQAALHNDLVFQQALNASEAWRSLPALFLKIAE
jgi:hypothetical protein